MKKILIVAICLAVLAAGCSNKAEQKPQKSAKTEKQKALDVAIKYYDLIGAGQYKEAYNLRLNKITKEDKEKYGFDEPFITEYSDFEKGLDELSDFFSQKPDKTSISQSDLDKNDYRVSFTWKMNRKIYEQLPDNKKTDDGLFKPDSEFEITIYLTKRQKKWKIIRTFIRED